MARSETGQQLISLVGFPAITNEAVRLVDDLLNRVLDENPKVLFNSDPMRLALSAHAKTGLTGGSERVRVASLAPGYCILARRRDYTDIVQLDSRFLLSPERMLSRSRLGFDYSLGHAGLSSAGTMYASHLGLACWPVGRDFAVRAGAGPSYARASRLEVAQRVRRVVLRELNAHGGYASRLFVGRLRASVSLTTFAIARRSRLDRGKPERSLGAGRSRRAPELLLSRRDLREEPRPATSSWRTAILPVPGRGQAGWADVQPGQPGSLLRMYPSAASKPNSSLHP